MPSATATPISAPSHAIAPDPAAASDRRQTWIDLLRGASVLLVVLSHAHGFALTAAGLESSVGLNLLMRAVGFLNTAVGPIRMELMFLLSGLFVARGLGKGPRRYVLGKLDKVLYPFLVWALLNFSLREAGAVLIKGQSVSWQNLVDLLVGRAPPTWFLFDLFVFFLLAPALRRVPILWLLPALVVVSMGLEQAGLARLASMAYYLAYFCCGDAIARGGHDLATRFGAGSRALSALSLACIAMLAIFTDLADNWVGYLPLVLASLPAVAWLSLLATRTPLAEPLTYAGRNSIVFYLVHFTLFIALVHVLGYVTGNPTVIFLALLGIGIAASAAISLARQRGPLMMFERLFSAGLGPTLHAR